MVMKINLEEMNPGTFFPFNPDAKNKEEKKEGVTVRVLTGEKLDEIFEKTQVRKSEVKGNPPTRFVYSDYIEGGEEKEFEMTWDYCITDWKGVVNKDGNEIPCNKENKFLLMKGSPKFSSFVTSCVMKLNEASGLYEKAKEKN